ncbi:pirin family protein [Mycolicibacterium sphagni]|uniref:Pirin family protein n=1 Tax=Mycolicibacterium sphagni TaxID=1786 RepID=A0ABX2JW13_9MYCO|nr:pirin family protein [Mycolicibacterium sphagni]NTY61615.1 pirin family protein [Mycolicibacterium sphagni]
MSNLETAPKEFACVSTDAAELEVLSPREVPLGGVRALPVRRTLPQHQRSLIGAWCFADHYGPQDLRESAGMDVPPHPHTGLQTVSWLFRGQIEHRDSAGVHQLVNPGELNLMTAGAGICHSEVSTPATTVLHGVQLWVALPDAHRNTARDFDHFVPEPVSQDNAEIRVFLGELAGQRSPVHTFTPLLGAQLDLAAGGTVDLDVDPGFEHGVLLDLGRVDVAGRTLDSGQLAYLGPGCTTLRLYNPAGMAARVVLLGGAPFTEELLMWWNFVARSHDEIASFRQLWQDGDDRFGAVNGYTGSVPRLPAPALPATRLRPRRRP